MNFLRCAPNSGRYVLTARPADSVFLVPSLSPPPLPFFPKLGAVFDGPHFVFILPCSEGNGFGPLCYSWARREIILFDFYARECSLHSNLFSSGRSLVSPPLFYQVFFVCLCLPFCSNFHYPLAPMNECGLIDKDNLNFPLIRRSPITRLFSIFPLFWGFSVFSFPLFSSTRFSGANRKCQQWSAFFVLGYQQSI